MAPRIAVLLGSQRGQNGNVTAVSSYVKQRLDDRIAQRQTKCTVEMLEPVSSFNLPHVREYLPPINAVQKVSPMSVPETDHPHGERDVRDTGSPPVAVVTGASAGVGRAIAVAFAGRGHRVALLARGQAGLEGARADVERAGAEALVIPVDVSDAEAVFSAADRVVEIPDL